MRLNGHRLLSRTTVEFILANQIGDLMNDRGDYYGLVFGGEDENAQNLGGKGHAGTFQWGGYFNTQYFADPKEEIIGVLMKQTQAIPKIIRDGNSGKWWKRRLMTEEESTNLRSYRPSCLDQEQREILNSVRKKTHVF